MGDEEKKYVKGKAKVEGAEKFYSNNEANQKYIENIYTSNGKGGSCGMPHFNPAIPSDAKRIFRYDPETKTFVNDLYKQENDACFEEDPSKHYEHIDSFDLESLGNGSYIYFEAGSSQPLIISKFSGTSEIKKGALDNNPDFAEAIKKEAEKREQMTEAQKQDEISRHDSQIFNYDVKRTTYLLDALFGSSIETGTDNHKNFAQYVNSDLKNLEPQTDYNYNTPNNRLSEEEMMAITIFCMGDPKVNGKACPGDNEMWNCAGAISMWPADLFIERSGKKGYMLDQLSNARKAAKQIIEEYDRTGNKEILADLIVRSIEATGLSAGAPSDISHVTYGCNTTYPILDKFIKDPELAKLVEKRAAVCGKSKVVKESSERIAFASNLHKFGVVKSSNEHKLSNLNEGLTDAGSDEDREYEIKEAAKTKSINDSIEALLKFETNISSTPTKQTQEVVNRQQEEIVRISTDASLDGMQKAERIAAISARYETNLGGVGWQHTMYGLQKVLALDAGRFVVEQVLMKSNIAVNIHSSEDELRAAYSALEKAGIVPKYPDILSMNVADRDEKARRREENERVAEEYREECSRFNAYDAITNYTKEIYIGEDAIQKPEDVMVRIAKEKERIAQDVATAKDPLDFEGIDFDREKVLSDIEKFKAENPNATAEELRKEKCRLVGIQSVVASRIGMQTRFNKEAGIHEPINAETILAGMSLKDYDMEFFKDFSGSELEQYLQVYQNECKLCRNQSDFHILLEERIKPVMTLGRDNAQKPYESAINYAERYHKGLYAPKTDGSQMQFSMQDQQGNPKPDDINKLKEWQKDIDSVEIPVPEGWHERMIEFAVMGHSFTAESTDKYIKMCLGAGSTIPEGSSASNTAATFVFANCFGDDHRFNTHAYRSIIADSRRAVKEAIEKGDMGKIKEYYKTAFDTLYTQAEGVRDLKNSESTYADMKINGLLRCLNAQGISPQSIGITDEQLSMCKFFEKRMELSLREKALRNEISGHYANFALTRGSSEKDDFTKNPQILDDIIEEQAIRYIESMIAAEVGVRHDGGGSYTSAHEDKKPPREITPTEKLYLENPEGLIEYVKTTIYDSDGFKSLKNAKSYQEKAEILRAPESLVANELVKIALPEYNEKQPVDEILDEIKSEMDLDAANIEAYAAAGGENGSILSSNMKEMQKAYQELRDLRSSMEDTTTKENLKKLGPAYKKLSDSMTLFMNNASFAGVESTMNDQNSFYHKSTLDMYANQIAGQEAYEEHLEKLRAGAKMMTEGKLCIFSKNFKERQKVILELTADKNSSNKVKDIINKFAELQTSLNKAYEDKIKNPLEQANIKKMYGNLNASLDKFVKGKIEKGEEGLKFVLEGVQKSINKDMNMITPSDLSKSIKDLEARSSRIGGNSKEFTEMLNAAKAMLTVDSKDSHKLKEVTETLAIKSQKYIDAKKTVPITQVGKDRLNIAKELRDISNILTPKLTKAIIKQARDEVIKQPEKEVDKILERKNASIERIAQGWAKKSGSEIATGVSELMYMKELEKKAKNMTEAEIAQSLDPANVEKSITLLNKVSFEVLKNTSAEDFKKAIDENNIEEYVSQRFKEEGKAAAEKVKEAEKTTVVKKKEAEKVSREISPALV